MYPKSNYTKLIKLCAQKIKLFILQHAKDNQSPFRTQTQK